MSYDRSISKFEQKKRYIEFHDPWFITGLWFKLFIANKTTDFLVY